MSPNPRFTSYIPSLKSAYRNRLGLSGWICGLTSFALGAIFLFSLAPYNHLWVAVLSLCGVYGLVRQTDHPFWIGLCYGTGLWFTGSFWIYTSIHDFGGTPAALAVLLVFLCALVMSLFHAFAFKTVKNLGLNVFSFAAIWVIQEWAKTWVLTGFPWLFAGYALTDSAAAGLAPVFSVLGVSFVLVLICASLWELIFTRRRLLMLAVILVTIGVSAGVNQISFTEPNGKPPLKAALVQGNIPQDLKWLESFQVETLRIYYQLSEPLWGNYDAVIWPESAIPLFQTQVADFMGPVARTAEDTGTTWVTGVPYADYSAGIGPDARYYNSIIAFDPANPLPTEVGQQYTSDLYKKQNLVPFGEYVPFGGWLDWVIPGVSDGSELLSFSAGPIDQRPLSVQGRLMGSALCYEAAYPATTANNAKNTDFMLTISNDAWFGTSAGPLQHLQMVQMRARETGRWFVRATNTGVTALIAPGGEITERAPQFKRGVLPVSVPGMTGETPFMRFGFWPLLAICLMILAASYLRRGRPRYRY